MLNVLYDCPDGEGQASNRLLSGSIFCGCLGRAAQLAFVERQDAIGHGKNARIVRDHEDGFSHFPAEVFQQSHRGLAGLGIERSGRLIGQNQFGIRHQGAGQCHPLSLPHAQLGNVIIGPVRQAHGFEHIRSDSRLAARPDFPSSCRETCTFSQALRPSNK